MTGPLLAGRPQPPMQDELLLRIARRELARRGPRLAITGPELDDLAYQAAADALLAITGKVRQFRGESRFTTWAYKCVMLEVSAKIGRHFWRHPSVPLGTEQWGAAAGPVRLRPSARGGVAGPGRRRAPGRGHRAHPRQREVFAAIVVNGVPLDALVVSLGSSRGAIYKVMFDARRKLRAALAANGYLPDDAARDS